jgi:PAS domain S-box-containing protein
MADNSHDIVFRAHYRPSFGYDYVSKSSLHITGYVPEEFYADPLLAKKCILPEDLPLLKDPSEHGNQASFEPAVVRWRCKDGRIIWMEQFLTLNRDARGQPETCLIIARDITERQLAEEALQIEKNKLQSVIDAMTDCLTILNHDFNIIFQNEKARASTGGDHVGEKCYRVFENSDKVCEGCPVAKSFRDGLPHTSARKRVLPSGEISFWENTANPVRDAGGKVIICLEIGRDITESKNAEKALQESQQFASSLLENAPHATMVISADTSVRYVNPAWERLNGWTLPEVVGFKAPYPWWPKEFGKDFVPTYIEAIHQPVGNGEILAIKKNGDSYWIDMNWVSVTRDGEFQYAIINSVDITERKQAEERRQAILKTALDGFCVTDLNGKFIEVNDSYCAMTGYTQEELLGMSIGDIDAQASPRHLTDLAENIVKQGSTRLETKHRCKDGRIIDLEISSKYIDTGEGHVYSFIRDITERKKVEKALRESEEKFSTAFHSSPVTIAITTLKDGKYVEVNDSYIKATGYTSKELLGRSSAELNIWAEPEDRVRLFKMLEELGRVSNEEFDFRMKSGEIRTWLFSAERINFAGEPCLIGEAIDITERKRMEESLAMEATRRRILIEQSRDGIVILDQNGAVYEANLRFAEMLGYSHEEVMKLHVWDWEYLYPREQVIEMIRTVDEAGDHFKTQHRRKDGSVYDVEISTNGTTFSTGQKLIFCVCRDISERNRMEKALRESEEKFSRAFLASPGSISISRLDDGTFIEVNESFLRDKGYTRKEVIGHRAPDLKIWAKDEDRQRIIKTLREGGSVRNQVVQFRTKSGFIRTGLVSADVITLGNEQCVVVLNTDITQQKQAEEQLRLLGSVTRQVTDSIITTDPKLRITYMNRAAEDMFGYTFDEVRGKNLSFCHVAPVSEKTSQEVRATIGQGKVWCETIAKKRKDGRVIICDCRLSPLYDESGQISAYIDVQRDITNQKEVELKLQAQRQLIENILATMPAGVLVIAGNDSIILANESFYKIFHRSKKSVINCLLKDILPVDSLLRMYNGVKLADTDKGSLEFRYRVRNHKKIIVCGAIKMDGDRTLLTFRDVSREREEEEKLYLTDRLASIGEMAAGLAHELNNPLTGILSLSALLTDADIPEDCREDIQCINAEAKRAANIVKNVLLFTRNNNYENGQASVNEVIKDVLRLREHEAKSHNIKVVTSLQDNLPDIIIDKFQLQQVFLNIILNAEAAIKDGGRPGILTINTAQVGSFVDISITDNGCGIKKNILPRIFDPFFTTKEIGKGTGLGLSICYGIVSKHGGKISVSTRVNQGSTFTVRLPAVVEATNGGEFHEAEIRS